MANEKEKDQDKTVGLAKNPKPKPGIIDLYKKVKLVATAKAPHHKEGAKIECSKTVADKMLANGWAKEAE